jgi:hypothetical protein
MAGKFKYFGQNGQNGQAKKRALKKICWLKWRENSNILDKMDKQKNEL